MGQKYILSWRITDNSGDAMARETLVDIARDDGLTVFDSDIRRIHVDHNLYRYEAIARELTA